CRARVVVGQDLLVGRAVLRVAVGAVLAQTDPVAPAVAAEEKEGAGAGRGGDAARPADARARGGAGRHCGRSQGDGERAGEHAGPRASPTPVRSSGGEANFQASSRFSGWTVRFIPCGKSRAMAVQTGLLP